MAERLERLERWVQEVITHPDGVGAGAASRPAEEALATTVESVVLPSATLSASERIGIYAGMYYLRLIEVLDGDFPGLKAVLGSDAFLALLHEYVAAHPSRHYSLNMLGAQLAAYVREERAELPHAAFLAELAELERALQEAFDAPAAEPLSTDELLAIPADRWAATHLVTSPSLRLFEFEHPINAWYVAFKEGDAGPVPEPVPSWTAVYRKEFRVWRASLTHARFELLSAIHDGATLGDALERAAATPGTDPDELAASVGAWFQDWAGDGIFVAIEASC